MALYFWQTQFGKVTRRRDGGITIHAEQVHLRDWAERPRNQWPCSTLAHLEWIQVGFDGKGDLVEIINDPEDLMGDELTAWASDVVEQLPDEFRPAWAFASRS